MAALLIAALAVLLLIMAAVIWQHWPRPQYGGITFGTEDAVDFMASRIDSEVFDRLGRAGLRRVVEWEVYYLQGLAQQHRRQPVVSIAGDYDPAVEYIVNQIASRHGVTYPAKDVGEALEGLASYMASIGAVGSRAEEDVR